jgi:hypothetical protein
MLTILIVLMLITFFIMAGDAIYMYNWIGRFDKPWYAPATIIVMIPLSPFALYSRIVGYWADNI